MILASSSPQRKRLIQYVTYETECLSVDTDETFDPKLPIDENIKNVAKNKALAVIEKYNVDNDVVIGADTIVRVGEEILLKPTDYDDAYRMISLYKENDVEVISGVCVAYVVNGKVNIETFIEISWIKFNNVTDESIKQWLALDDYLDCSGAIKIEKVKGLFEVEIEGSVSNIIGLPLEKLTSLHLAHIVDDRFEVLHEDQVETPLRRTRSTSRIIPFDGEFVYFIKQTNRTNDLGYSLIGGGCTLDEEILEAGQRELLEEAGMVVENVTPLGVSYIYHERPDDYLGVDKFWAHQFMSFAKVVEVKNHERLDYEENFIKGIEKATIDEAIQIFTEQEEKFKNAENTFFYWFNLGVVDALKKMKKLIEK